VGGSGAAGTLNITAGATVVAGSTILIGGSANSGTGAGGTGILNLSGGGSLSGNSGLTIQSTGILNIGGATANASTAGLLSTGDNMVNNGAINFNQTDSAALAQTIAGLGTLKQAGSGVTTLTGANNYSGGTTIAGGTLVAANASAFGAGPVTLMNGGTLKVTSSGLILGNSSSLTVNGALEFTSMSGDIQLNNAGYTLNGTLDLDDAFDSAPSGTYTLIAASSGSDISVILSGFNNPNEVATFSDGQLTLNAVPEPASYGVLAGLGLLLVSFRRFHRQA
jgi:autotransporter-associated beta strand protein